MKDYLSKRAYALERRKTSLFVADFASIVLKRKLERESIPFDHFGLCIIMVRVIQCDHI